MESLRTESVKIRLPGGWRDYRMEEKDHGDLVVYDIFREDHYLELRRTCFATVLLVPNLRYARLPLPEMAAFSS
jgi:hypothetical protein